MAFSLDQQGHRFLCSHLPVLLWEQVEGCAHMLHIKHLNVVVQHEPRVSEASTDILGVDLQLIEVVQQGLSTQLSVPPQTNQKLVLCVMLFLCHTLWKSLNSLHQKLVWCI